MRDNTRVVLKHILLIGSLFGIYILVIKFIDDPFIKGAAILMITLALLKFVINYSLALFRYVTGSFSNLLNTLSFWIVKDKK